MLHLKQTIDVKGNIKISPKTGEAETGVIQIQAGTVHQCQAYCYNRQDV